MMPISLRRLICVLVLLAVPPVQAAAHAVILMYHHFGTDTPAATSVTPAQFDSHLEYLAAHDYRVWPLEQVVEYLRERRALPDRVVAITVDDAYVSVYHEAWPRLRARGWPFTVFVATDPVDAGAGAMMDWGQLRELAAAGVTLANHSRSHDHLVRRRPGEDAAGWRARVRADLLYARQRLEQELGQAPQLLAWPYGEYNTELQRLAEELGYTAFGQQSGPASIWSSPQAQPRFPMAVAYAAIDDVRDKLESRPLPVLQAVPEDPVLAPADDRPLLRVTLQAGGYRPDTLGCYVSGQGRIEPRWLDVQRTRFEVRAPQPLPAGRSRYNCTAQATAGGGWLWFSQPWIRPHADGSWYRE